MSRAGGRNLSFEDDEDAAGAGDPLALEGSDIFWPSFSLFLCFAEDKWAS